MMRAFICSMVGHRPAAMRYQQTAGATSSTWECCPRCQQHHRPDTSTALLVRTVAQGHTIPAGYGVAWVRWQDGNAVCMPVPLNIAAAAGRRAWAWVKFPRCLFRDPRQAFLEGYQLGLRAGADQQKGPTP